MSVSCLAVALSLGSAVAFAQPQQADHDRAKTLMPLDLNKDGVIDRAEAAKSPRLAERFEQLDANKDGKLSVDERSHRHGKHGSGAMHSIHHRMKALDTDNDARISRSEAAAGQGKLGGRFDQMDVNRDGYLDRVDMQARGAQRRAEFFMGADANRDGRVTRDEFVVEHGARSAERRAKWAQRAQATGKQMRARQSPSVQRQLQFTGKAFDRMDTNKDGALTRSEFDAFKPNGHGHGMVKSEGRPTSP
ncbi:MAG: EF-hand domain-containing protein [Pseudomonadota bacterium]|nr:EF-hand domain-containing protein [Pseudomonadota bacterium]